MIMAKKIGAFICQCGGNISNVVDVDKIAKELEDENEDLELAEVETYLCSEPSIERMKEVIEEKGLDRLVLACCTPKMHLKKFQRVLKEAGVNPALVDVVNVREHREYGIPSVLIEADARAKIHDYDLDLIYAQLVEKVGHTPSLLRLRRERRPFR